VITYQDLSCERLPLPRSLVSPKSDIIAKGIRFNYGRDKTKKRKSPTIGFFICVGFQKNRIPLAIMSLFASPLSRSLASPKSDIIAKGIRFNYGRNILKKSKINNIGFFIYGRIPEKPDTLGDYVSCVHFCRQPSRDPHLRIPSP
jgi:hypothetical protein